MKLSLSLSQDENPIGDRAVTLLTTDGSSVVLNDALRSGQIDVGDGGVFDLRSLLGVPGEAVAEISRLKAVLGNREAEIDGVDKLLADMDKEHESLREQVAELMAALAEKQVEIDSAAPGDPSAKPLDSATKPE